MDKVVNKI